MEFRFNERKATAVAALILKEEGGATDLLRVVKLLYLAERESLRVFNRPIFGDRYFSMQHGPVPSRAYDLMKGSYTLPHLGEVWAQHIAKVGRHTLKLEVDPGSGPLSEADIQVVRQVCDEHSHRDTWDLVEFTHRLPEWSDPGSSSTPIDVEKLLDQLGKSAAEREQLEEEQSAAREFERLFG